MDSTTRDSPALWLLLDLELHDRHGCTGGATTNTEQPAGEGCGRELLGQQALTGAPANVAVAGGVEILGAERVGERRLVASWESGLRQQVNGDGRRDVDD